MNPSPDNPPSHTQVLRRLYLLLFLRGRSARGLHVNRGPKSVAGRLWLTLVIYALFGCMSLGFLRQPLFSLSIYLHGASLFFVGFFVASSSGEVLFNQQEAEILLHRPVSPRSLLWAKAVVLLQISLWMSVAFNLAGMLVGSFSPTGSLLYLPAHLVSTTLSAMFCTGAVVLVYQLCLKWFGRKRLDSLMTLAQIAMTMTLVLGGQVAPHLMRRLPAGIHPGGDTWWLALLPPAWFAGLDETLVGRGNPVTWGLAAFGVVATVAILALAFGKLTGFYEQGLQTMTETGAPDPGAPGKPPVLQRLVAAPPVRWLLRNPLERAGFLLVAAYMFRDRDVKLRLYPGLVPICVMPVIMLANSLRAGDDAFMLLLAGSYIPLIPMLALNLLRYSQHWQAADVFLITPTAGPGGIMVGARKAVELFLTLPALLLMLGASLWIGGSLAKLSLLLPGILMLPVYTRFISLSNRSLPLSLPCEQAKSANRGWMVLLSMFSAMILGGIAAIAKAYGCYLGFLITETTVTGICMLLMDRKIRNLTWAPIDDSYPILSDTTPAPPAGP